jgi:hypothetical protein
MIPEPLPPNNHAAAEPNLCRITLLGPVDKERPKPSPLKLKVWTPPEWRRIVLELRIGSQRCPNWDHANACLDAVKELIKSADGYLTDAVVSELTNRMDLVSFKRYQGPPRG